MRCRVVAFLLAFAPCALPGLPVLALPPIDLCEEDPGSPLCNPPDLEPPDPCELDPASCPVDPEPDPCELDPASCEPQPEPEPEPDAASFGTLHGALRVTARGQRKKQDAPVHLVIRGTAFDMVALAGCDELEGTLEPGKRAAKAEIFFDARAELTFAAIVAGLAAEAAGGNPGETVGQSLKITLKEDPSGEAILKIKGSVLFEDAGKVTVKAKYLGTLEESSLPEAVACSSR
jgi:hypothetical protein